MHSENFDEMPIYLVSVAVRVTTWCSMSADDLNAEDGDDMDGEGVSPIGGRCFLADPRRGEFSLGGVLPGVAEAADDFRTAWLTGVAGSFVLMVRPLGL